MLFFQFFRMLHSPESMHPQSRYPDGNVTTVVGAGLDELMRHVPSLRPQCIKALVASFKEVRTRESCVCDRRVAKRQIRKKKTLHAICFQPHDNHNVSNQRDGQAKIDVT